MFWIVRSYKVPIYGAKLSVHTLVGEIDRHILVVSQNTFILARHRRKWTYQTCGSSLDIFLHLIMNIIRLSVLSRNERFFVKSNFWSLLIYLRGLPHFRRICWWFFYKDSLWWNKVFGTHWELWFADFVQFGRLCSSLVGTIQYTFIPLFAHLGWLCYFVQILLYWLVSLWGQPFLGLWRFQKQCWQAVSRNAFR